MSEKLVSDIGAASAKFAEAALKKAWSVMDAAAEKDAPSKFLSPQAIESIQGKTPDVKE